MVGGRTAEDNGQAVAGTKRSSDLSTQPGSTPQKRSRVSRACDQCRASREKCDGAQPVCQTCGSLGRACSYNEQPKKRGIQPNYIRTLELMLAWLFRTFPETEARLAIGLPDRHDAASKIISSTNGPAAELAHQAWRNGIVCRQIDQILSGVSVEHWEPAASSHAEEPHHNRSLRSDSSNHDRAGIDGSLTPARAIRYNRNGSPEQTRLKLPDTAWDLLEYYFAFTQSWLPMTEKPAILKLMYSYPPEGILQGDSSTAVYAELWSILALAEAQLHVSDHGSDRTSLYDIARSLIPSDFGAYELSHVKALLVLGLVEITKQRWLAAWLFIGSAVRLLIVSHADVTERQFHDVGNGSRFPHLATPGSYGSAGENPGVSTSSPSETTSRLKHVTLAAFVLEAAVAFELKAPTHLQLSHISAVGLLNEDGLEEWSPWHDPLEQSSSNLKKAPSRCYSTFNNLVRMAVGRFESSSATTASSPASTNMGNIVLALAHNASRTRSRTQPTLLVAQYQAGAFRNDHQIEPTADIIQDQQATNHNTSQSAKDLQPAQQHQQHQQQLLFMSIPNESPDSVFGRSPSLPLNGTTSIPDLWSPSTPQNNMLPNQLLFPESSVFDSSSGTGNGDIFEELALLERTDSTQHPQFMQNLGFAPDLDLAEFFGADYQPSDPLLAYMQPSVFGLAQAEGPSGNRDAGDDGA